MSRGTGVDISVRVSRAPQGMVPVETPVVAGVKMHRHKLDIEASRLSNLAQRLGKRLRAWCQQTDRPEGEMPVLPDEDVRETFKLYSGTVKWMLEEQRHRAKLAGKDGVAELTDEQYAEGLKQLANETAAHMSDRDFEELLEARAKAINATVVEAGKVK